MNTEDFLFEIGTEELPPKRITALVSSLADNLEKELCTYNLKYTSIETYSSPRRLAILITDLVTKQSDQQIEFRGPPVGISFDDAGKPTVAAEKFAASCGVTVDQLERIEDKKGKFLFCKGVKKGKLAAELLPEIVTNSLKKLPIPRLMHWGDSKIFFIRPVHSVVMLLGKAIIHTEIFGIKTSNKTFGHRFHAPAAITIDTPKNYEALLEKAFVIADTKKRKQKIRDQIKTTIKVGTAIIDENLLDEVTDLVEWPVVLLGNFDSRFLEIPSEVLMTSLMHHQRCFPIIDANGKLLPQFVIVSNIQSKNPTCVISGNERVVRARLTDAEYFYRSDLKLNLEQYNNKLKFIVFQETLKSIYDKTCRLKQVANFIAQKIDAAINSAHIDRATTLSKCDLATSMVWEFPELQGVMGYYYAQKQNEPADVACALKEQYLPRFAGDAIPNTDIGCVLAIADRIDNLIGLFGINKIPTGEKDPFGLRRAATGILRIILEKKLHLDLKELIACSIDSYNKLITNNETAKQVLNFIYERLRNTYAEQGKSTNLFSAVLAVAPTNLLDFENRLAAVDEFNQLPEACDLVEIYKRVKNILNKAEFSDAVKFDTALAQEPAEKELIFAIEKESLLIEEFRKNKKYLDLLKTLVKLKPNLSAFFNHVMVMVDDKTLRQNRLALLKNLQNLFTLVADLSWLVSGGAAS